MQNKLNQTEKKAFNWLSLQYKTVLYQKNTPRFLVADKTYEPKKLYGSNVVVIRQGQYEAIRKCDSTVLVFGEGPEPVAIIPAKEISPERKTWNRLLVKIPGFRYKLVTPMDIMSAFGSMSEQLEQVEQAKTFLKSPSPPGPSRKKPMFQKSPISAIFEAIGEERFMEHQFTHLLEEDPDKKETAITFNTYLLLRRVYGDVSSGMIASWCGRGSPKHVGSVLKHMGIQRENRASGAHPRARFVVWDDGLMRRLFAQYGHEEFQAQFPGAKPYYKKPSPETLF